MYGIVEIFSYETKEKSKCGYCKNKNGSLSYGMWGHSLTVENYQDLTDRGWRRSGHYCYKPDMNETCCPLYTIRCNADEFTLSKSQKNVLRRMKQFLISGKSKQQVVNKSDDKVEEDGMDVSAIESQRLSHIADKVQSKSEDITKPNVVGPDPNKPLRLKAKQLRRERKMEKLAAQPLLNMASTKRQCGGAKSLRDHLEEEKAPDAKYKLQVVTVRSCITDERFQQSFATVHALYRKYQLAVHNDKPEHCSQQQFQRFLIDSPLTDEEASEEETGVNYGSYHQQYWLNDQLIAVGVIDILPKYLSSVYFFYDPDYSFLSLGTYGALREIAFTQNLRRTTHPQIEHYLMGFYIHSCVKMRYKGQFSPSFLLCPETYTWHPIEAAKKKLDVSKYSRLENDATVADNDGRTRDEDITILYKRNITNFKEYSRVKNVTEREKKDVHTYAAFVGKKAAKHLLLYRS